jgi:hypothetical protein
MNGYMGRKWHILRPNINLLIRLVAEGELYAIEDAIFLVTKPEKRFRHPQSSLTILDGPPAKSLRAAKEIAGRLGARILSSYIPYDRYLLFVTKRLGYRRNPWGRHFYGFEKQVP